MIISQTAEYALRAAVLLARAEGGAMTTPQLAAASKIPAHYLAKILQEMRRAGLVESQRGLRGGFILARPAGDITALEVINALDPIERIHTCPLKLKSHGTQLCPLHRKLDDAIATVQSAFGASKLSDLASPAPNACRALQG
jgi:Rrf2 family nitric oxide-sensitive transcriptional repressor